MSTRLVILGFLRFQPLHGYEIKQLIEQKMEDWTSIAFGSIYFALRKLEEERLIEKIATEQEGNRPSRSVYQITDAGHEEFMRLLRQVWREVEHPRYSFDIGVFFMQALPKDEIVEYLKGRVAQLEETLDYLEAHRVERLADPRVLEFANAIFDHGKVHLEAELTWTRDLLGKVERGEYP